MQVEDIRKMAVTESFYKVLYATLIANLPRDTFNMLTQSKLIGMRDNGTHWVIVITGPRQSGGKPYDYAYNVNYNQKRGPKERANYHYVERNIRQVATVFGLEVNV